MLSSLIATLLAAPGPAVLLGDGRENYEPVVAYTLSAQLDPDSKTVRGRGTLSWTNRTSVSVDTLQWHLYLNAFRNENSTFMRESGGQLRGDEVEVGEWGYIELTRLVHGGRDLLSASRFIHPDDLNLDDKTVLETRLARSVLPDETIELELSWTAKLPKVFARTGYAGDFFMIAQWFPKLGVLEGGGPNGARWNCHQFHASSEFYADYGSYHVSMTVPSGYEVGATGVRLSLTENADGTRTFVHAQDRVHDFAWTADPRFVRVSKRFTDADVDPEHRAEAAKMLGLKPSDLTLPDVQVQLLVQPEHLRYRNRYMRATFAAIEYFGLWYGPYPYSVLTVVDGPLEGRGAMGMEYPTLITGGVRWPSAAGSHSPESVTVHEFGHQYWYGLVGSNEFEEAWLDEGFTTYSTGKVMDRAYGPRTLAPKFMGIPLVPIFRNLTFDQLTWSRVAVLIRPDVDPVVQPAWHYRDDLSYGVNSYPKSALVLRQLENEIGPEATAQALRLYQLRWRYRHPKTKDFIDAVDEAAGREMRPFFERTIFSAKKLDYAVRRFTSKPIKRARGVFTSTTSTLTADLFDVSDDSETDRFRTVVELERRGEISRPVPFEVRFADGRATQRQWDGEGRWQRFEFLGGSKARDVRLYPGTPELTDLDDANDSRQLRTDPRPALTFAGHALYLFQSALSLLGALL